MKVLNNHESNWIKDIEDHTHPRGKHLEIFEVIGAQKAKETKKYVLGEKCQHVISRCRHLKTDLNLGMKCQHIVLKVLTPLDSKQIEIKVSAHVT